MKKARDTWCVKVEKYMCLYFSGSCYDISYFCMFVFSPFHFTRTLFNRTVLDFFCTHNTLLCL